MARILVIEDEAPLREEILEWLGFEGYEALGASNGQEGIALARQWLPDLILTDINMPAVSGVRFVENLKSKGCTCPNIAIISGNWTDSDLKRANRMDVSVFSKPLCPAHIRSWLDKIEQKAQESGERESRNPDREGYRPN